MPPDSEPVPTPCRSCGDVFPVYPDYAVTLCRACRLRAEHAQAEREGREAFLARVRPPLYAMTVRERLPCEPHVVAAVEGWQATAEKPFLLLHGVSGRGKSRLLWLVLTPLILRGERPVVFGPGEFSLAVVSAWRDGTAEHLIARLKSAAWLVLDDIDKDKFTERVEEALFGVLEHRLAWSLPTLLATNATGAVLESKFTTAAGPALVRRLREYSVAVAP